MYLDSSDFHENKVVEYVIHRCTSCVMLLLWKNELFYMLTKETLM